MCHVDSWMERAIRPSNMASGILVLKKLATAHSDSVTACYDFFLIMNVCSVCLMFNVCIFPQNGGKVWHIFHYCVIIPLITQSQFSCILISLDHHAQVYKLWICVLSSLQRGLNNVQ